ncbi:hypothetical protein JK208_06035 [Gluconobacter sp. Dm-74]|nr:hypothetical protein [Gluconobacter sp. Dm-74]
MSALASPRTAAKQGLDWFRALRAIVHGLIATRDRATYMAERNWGLTGATL